ncbi:Alpha/Beta hydrolase protein [Obelidium mucronatum]|nr:Alpha/Beta hydrolase protein [Obelidium mucronatum]
MFLRLLAVVLITAYLGLLLLTSLPLHLNNGNSTQHSYLWNYTVAAGEYRVKHSALPWASNVNPITESFAGLIDIRRYPEGWQGSKTADSATASLFFWYFPCQSRPTTETPPLIIWLQGGPGSSSMIGLFYEMGPLRVDSNFKLSRHNATWNKKASMLFIDNPVGVGYSAVHHSTTKESPHKQPDTHSSGTYNEGYVTNQDAVARDLVIFLEKFYKLFPEQRLAPLYIAGESYAGKYVPSFANGIIARNNAEDLMYKSSDLRIPQYIPLRGIAIGNGLTDPPSQVLSHAPLALAVGLVSKKQAEVLDFHANDAIQKAERKEWHAATLARNEIFAAFKNFTGNINPYDIRKGSVQNSWADMETLLNLDAVKQALNVPLHLKFEKDPLVASNLFEDGMKSMKPVVEKLLTEQQFDADKRLDDSLKVLLYQGQFDFRDGILSSNDWISGLEWNGQKQYQQAPREVWRMNDAVVGYTTQFEHLKRVEILHAGHLSPKDSPEAIREMIFDFIG